MALLQISEPGMSVAPHEHRLAVGIDLGTTNSLVATVRSGMTSVLPDSLGRPLLPSIVRYAKDGSVEVGYAAQRNRRPIPRTPSVPGSASRGPAWKNALTTRKRPKILANALGRGHIAPRPGG